MAATDTLARRSKREREQGNRASQQLRALGPGLITGASDDDPSGIAAYSQAGAQFGFAISWTMLLIMLMHMTANRKIMREFKVNGGLMIVGWIATAVMAGLRLRCVSRPPSQPLKCDGYHVRAHFRSRGVRFRTSIFPSRAYLLGTQTRGQVS
jgi:Mn2+/Fe2+ NRAMP family transporter